jgi:hypothetical protein
MATVATVAFAGALLGIALISRIPIWALRAWKEKSFLRLFFAHLMTFALAAAAYALASADGGAPQWHAGLASYALPSLLVFGLDALAIAAGRHNPATPAAASLWFLHAGGTQSGPLTTEALSAQLAQGSVQPSDWIWRNGFTEWMQIQAVDLSKPAEPAAQPEGRPEAVVAPSASWRDWIALPLSYWVSGLIIAALFAASSLALLNLDFVDHPRLISAGIIILWLAVLAAMLWLSIGVFRSLAHHAEVFPNRYWGAGAKVMTALVGLAVVGVFTQQGVPQIRNSANVISETMAPRYQLRLLRDNTELELVGPMDFGLADAALALLADNPRIATVYVNSPGGRVTEADSLAGIVLAKNLNTYVSTFCLSECATVFAAGKNRWLSRSAVIALNQPNGEASDLAVTIARTKAFLQGRGVEAKFIDRSLANPREHAWRPSHAELFNSGLATSYATDAEVSVAGIPVREIEEAEKALDRIGLYQVLRDKHPKAHEEILAVLRTGYVRGQSVAAMRQRIWAIILPITNKSLSSASDSALISFYQIATDEAEVYARKDPKSCEAYLKGRAEGFDPALLTPELQERELNATAELIRTSGSYFGKAIEKKEVEAVLAQLLPEARSKGFSATDLERATQFKLDPQRNCQGLLIFLRSLLRLEDPSRIALLRFMAQQSGT